MTRIPAPFNLASIPPEHAFGGHLNIVAKGDMIEYDESCVESVRVVQTWYSDTGKKRLRAEFLEMLRVGRVRGLTEEELPKENEVDPYVCVEMRRIGDEEGSVSWFWDGDGVYDGYETNGIDPDDMDDDVLGALDDDTDEESDEESEEEDVEGPPEEEEEYYS